LNNDLSAFVVVFLVNIITVRNDFHTHKYGIAEFAGLEFAGLENDGLDVSKQQARLTEVNDGDE